MGLWIQPATRISELGLYLVHGGSLETSSSRIFVVEDSEPFRKFICSTLGKRPELQIIAEVADGLEAVQKAQELQPDLISLDIGLPTLNGIEAARRIRQVSPTSTRPLAIVMYQLENRAEAVCAARVGRAI
jgi:CheY-like chemotaxis protein